MTDSMELDERSDIELMDEDGSVDTDTSNYITTPYMTKYEKARILGTRALQIR